MGTLFADELGSAGEPLVLLHGNEPPEAGEPLAARLSATHRVWLVHRPGYGGSAALGPSSAPETARLLVETMEAGGVDRFHVAGHSFGSYIALRLALDWPERVVRMSLLSPLAGVVEEEAAAFAAASSALREGADLTDALIERWVPPAYLEAHPEVVKTLRRWQNDERHAMADDIAAAAAEPVLLEQLPRVRAPALLRVGALDAATPPAGARAMAERLPHARLEVVDAVGHLLAFEDLDGTATSMARFHGPPGG